MKYFEVEIPQESAYIIPLGDIHLGDIKFTKESEEKLTGYLKWIKERDNAYAFLGGDVFNVAGRNSKTSPFETQTSEYERAIEIFEPYKDKILFSLDGNHENRMIDEFGISPMQSFCRELKIPYGKWSAVLRVKVGKREDNRWNQNYFIYAHHCFDEQTEILTRSGWKKHGDLLKGEPVATLNTDSNLMEWNAINEIYKYDDFKTMVRFQTKTCDLVVSHDHTMLDRSRNTGDITKKYAREFIDREANFPASAINNNSEYPIEDDLLKLLCWVITEGTRFTKRNKSEVRITQSDKPKVDHHYILDIIDRLADKIETKTNTRLKYKKGNYGNINRNYDAYEIYIKKCELSQKVKELIPDKKIPDFYFELSKRQFDIVLKELVLGDGTIDGRDGCNNCCYSQKDEKEIDRLQALCSINGYRTVKSKKEFWGGYRLSITPFTEHRIKKQAIKEVNYKGVAWCVSVENKTLFVRRNGKVSITGNTTGGGGSIGSKLNRVIKLREVVEGIDCYCGFHNHQLAAAPQDVFYPSMQEKGVKQRRIWYVDCGSYLEWNDSYAEKAMMSPVKLGSPRIRLDGKQGKHDVHISI